MTPFAHGKATATALLEADSGRSLTYAALDDATEKAADQLDARPSLAFHFATNTIDSVVTFLAARKAGHAVALLDPSLKPGLLACLVSLYEPQLITGRAAIEDDAYAEAGTLFWRRTRPRRAAIHPDLAVLLSTSGSTGSPKFVRLSAAAVEHNAGAIARSLDLTSSDRPFANLPMHYSYGMSVLTSHLSVGATVVVSDASVIEPRFWEQFAEHGATSLSGVPYTYQMLHRLGFLDRDLPTLRSMTQAGGRLAERHVTSFHDALTERGVRFYVMYGQTEAGPRMSCLAPMDTTRKLGSVGRPLPGGSFRIEAADGTTLAPGSDGEVVYRGPNVMMGYAESAEDLTLDDVDQGVLHTGDLGHLDEDGFLFITGRSKRIGKVFGARVSLDEVEALVIGLGLVAVVGDNDRLRIYHELDDDALVRTVRKQLALDLKVPTQALVFQHTDPLPILPSGKPDYATLRATEDAAS